MSSSDIQPLSIKALLSSNEQYVVPMYQRNYAWGEGEIRQLVQDIRDYLDKRDKGADAQLKYFIGTLVIYVRDDGRYEVIDGQQRFTTLSLLVNWLKHNAASDEIDVSWYNKINLEFESRPISTLTFSRLFKGAAPHDLRGDEFNESLVKGFELLGRELKDIVGNRLKSFCEYLFEYVTITRVAVPKDTDLNHYFEVMNNRGEQLEKHEVVKARLMSVLNESTALSNTEKQRSIYVLNRVWDACSYMERYVQYGFTTNERASLFGKSWGGFEADNFDELSAILASKDNSASPETTKTLSNILNAPLVEAPTSNEADDGAQERFTSIINFPNFLLHVLRICSKEVLENEGVPLDDKQLIEQFEFRVLRVTNPAKAVQKFTFALLKCKYLFDQYVIKREFAKGTDGWSLKRLNCYESGNASYINSFDERDGGAEGINRRILMLLSAFHVSTPTQVYKHWLNGAMNYLFRYYTSDTSVLSKEYLAHLEWLAKQFMFNRFLAESPKNYYQIIYQSELCELPSISVLKSNIDQLRGKLRYGSIENNFVFNYLDYLFWCKNQVAYSTYEFTFRSSVEHFSPQHPMPGYEHDRLDEQHLHSFGNLCLISHSKNSKLSNLQPEQKKGHFEKSRQDGKIDTLKLVPMLELLEKHKAWTASEVELHEQEMLNLMLS